MTDQLTALRELADKVEAGDVVTAYDACRIFPNGYCHAVNAGNGSLDAAQALHKAVLGERWTWRVYLNRFASVESCDAGPWIGNIDRNPARAWLLAIIKAKIWEIENE